MPADHSVVDRRPTKQHQAASGAAPPEPEHLPCPRCDSINTKFCYYNNYNFSQPRHFCKACRRYWTHGGTLRDIPIGGGSRKNAKRSRTAVVGSAAPALDYHHVGTATPILIPFDHHGGPMQFLGDHVKGNAGNTCGGSFTSLLNTQGGPAGLLALGGFGMGIGPGFEDVGFGLGRTVWPFASGVGDGGGGAAVTTGGSGGGNVMANMWQLESGEGGGFMGGGGGDCFSLPADLAISTPGISNAMK